MTAVLLLNDKNPSEWKYNTYRNGIFVNTLTNQIEEFFLREQGFEYHWQLEKTQVYSGFQVS